MTRFLRRDVSSDDTGYGPQTLIFLSLLLLAGCSFASVILLRRRRQQALRAATLPVHQGHGHGHGHHRTLTIATTPSNSRGEAIFVYDEKMNLIANSHAPPQGPVPEIHVTFPDDENTPGNEQAGRVVVLRFSDSGSVGMEPLHHEPLPPYVRTESGRFESLDLERIGGLNEKTQPTSQRYS